MRYGHHLGQGCDLVRQTVGHTKERCSWKQVHVFRPAAEKVRRVGRMQAVAVVLQVLTEVVRVVVEAEDAVTAWDVRGGNDPVAGAQRASFATREGVATSDGLDHSHVLMATDQRIDDVALVIGACVLLRLTAVGVLVRAADESKQYAGTDHERDIIYPLICGHENVGVIEAIGGADSIPDSEGRPLRRGDRIVPAANVPCGHCIFCLNDYPYYFCENLQDYGNSLHSGIPPQLFEGWAEYMYLLPGTPLFRVPDGLPDEVAALTEVMAVTHGFDRARMLTAGWGGSGFGASGGLG